MSETLVNVAAADGGDNRPSLEKPIIRILIYTDDPSTVVDDENDPAAQTRNAFGVGRLKAHLRLHQPAFASLCVEVKSRNKDEEQHTTCRLDDAILKAAEPFHEIWFFGLHQINKEPYSLVPPFAGGPRSELEDDEVAGLEVWMKSGGVLIAGDHANPDPRGCIPINAQFCPPGVDHETFLGLGRAIGHRVPRAGQLRKWQGPPTRCAEDNFNTQVLTTGTNYEDDALEKDATPQEVLPEFFDELGNPAPSGYPHPLFTDRDGRPITVFPDHTHEGRLTLPRKLDELDKKVWPEVGGVQPRPYAVAYGMDKGEKIVLPIVAAYDGDRAGVGRIVADSTWHHYFNINLSHFRAGEGDGPAADSIGQYYGNLALWLAPVGVRREMGRAMFRHLAFHPRMLEEAGSGALNIGATALNLLSDVASPCEINELLQVFIPAPLRVKCELLLFPQRPTAHGRLPPRELIFGSVVNQFHRAAAESVGRRFRQEEAAERDASTIKEGVSGAFAAWADTLRDRARDAQALYQLFT